MAKVYQKEKEKQRKRQERELRSSFRRFKKFVKGAARAGVDPEEYARAQQEEQRQQQQSASQSSQSSQSSDNFRERHRQQTQSEKQQREKSRGQQSNQQQSSSQSQQKSSSQSSHSSYQAPPKDKPKPTPKPQPKKITPLDKEFYDNNKEAFISAGWIYSPSEERFKKYDLTKLRSEAFKILDIPVDSDTKTIRKAKHRLSKQYTKFTYPIPTNTEEIYLRANQILAVINHAGDLLLK